MEDPILQDPHTEELLHKQNTLPPSPPDSEERFAGTKGQENTYVTGDGKIIKEKDERYQESNALGSSGDRTADTSKRKCGSDESPASATLDGDASDANPGMDKQRNDSDMVPFDASSEKYDDRELTDEIVGDQKGYFADNDVLNDVSPNVPLPPPSTAPSRVLDIDKKTPDSHVPRDPRLIRLTGVHPFNVEPPLTDLFNEGFLTSPELFYVRNHGAVPEVHDEDIPDWQFSVEGYVCDESVSMTCHR